MESEADRLRRTLQRYRFMIGPATDQERVSTLARLIGETEAQLRAIEGTNPADGDPMAQTVEAPRPRPPDERYLLLAEESRQRAQELRTIAATLIDPSSRATYARLAADDDRMADQAERLARRAGDLSG